MAAVTVGRGDRYRGCLLGGYRCGIGRAVSEGFLGAFRWLLGLMLRDRRTVWEQLSQAVDVGFPACHAQPLPYHADGTAAA